MSTETETKPVEATPEVPKVEETAPEAPAAPATTEEAKPTETPAETKAEEKKPEEKKVEEKKPEEKKVEEKKPVEKKKVVVLGGGFAGSIVAKSLQNEAEVTLVDTKDYFNLTWANLRALVEPAVAEKINIAHTSYLPKATVVVGEAASVTDKEVTLADGKVLPFDYLVIATGSKAWPPAVVSEKIAFQQAEAKKLKEAKSVLIVGGGPTGVELAGEIVTDLPETKVTLVHGGPRLLEYIGEKASAKALAWLKAKNVDVLLGEKIEDFNGLHWGSSGTLKTASGKEITADYIAIATGAKPDPSFAESSFKSLIVDGKFLKVDPFLKLEGTEKIFVLGDIADLKDKKQGFLAQLQALHTVKNLKALIKADATGKPVKALKKWPGGPPVALVSLGRKDGIAELPFGTFTGFFPTLMKSKSLFIEKVRKDLLGAKA